MSANTKVTMVRHDGPIIKVEWTPANYELTTYFLDLEEAETFLDFFNEILTQFERAQMLLKVTK